MAISQRGTSLTRRSILLLGLAVAGAMLMTQVYLGRERRSERQSLSRMIGQMIMVGFIGTDTAAPGFRRLIEYLETGVVGGVLILPRNIAGRVKLEAMVAEIRRCASPAVPLIAIDAEGGTVDWLSKDQGFEEVASAARVGQSDDDYARQQYALLARKLSEVGFNMNMAPVVDLSRNAQNTIIVGRERSYSADPAVVERYARIFIAEHHARGILTALKHFPGHGSSSADTHVQAADVEGSWSEDELVPYRSLLATGAVDAVMIGHLVNRRRWGGVATQQGATAISGLLRGELRFDGVVISDDLTMDAVRQGQADFPSVVASSINAGVDLVLVVHPVTGGAEDGGLTVNSKVVEAVLSGKIPRATIESSFRRIMALKKRAEGSKPGNQ